MRSHCLVRVVTVLALFLAPSWGAVVANAEEQAFPLKAERILFLGDSITHSGQYVTWIETQLRLAGVDALPQFVDIGLSSETCSGLSEPGHPFPRPDIHERLDRALEQTKPDVVVACYGMNDGIYHPFGEDRFAAFRDGIERIIEKVHAIDAKLVLLTPPPFDPVPLQGKGKLRPADAKEHAYFAMYENYNDVLTRYAEWIMQQGDRAEMVIDVHTPFMQALAEGRKSDPAFTMTPDGIHPNLAGHQVIGNAVLKAWGIEVFQAPSDKLFQLAHKKTNVLHDAWLSKIGHKRPGVRPGLPLSEAEEQAADLEQQIAELVTKETAKP